jgi:hypothetical protein
MPNSLKMPMSLNKKTSPAQSTMAPCAREDLAPPTRDTTEATPANWQVQIATALRKSTVEGQERPK